MTRVQTAFRRRLGSRTAQTQRPGRSPRGLVSLLYGRRCGQTFEGLGSGADVLRDACRAATYPKVMVLAILAPAPG
jgi:hypothetical protein